MKLAVLLFCFLVTSLSFATETASNSCVKEGDSIGVYPGAVTNCCAGLEKMPAPSGVYGSGGTCHKKVNNMFCYGEGRFRMGFTQLSCCPGLGGFVINMQNREFECRKVKTCVEENEQILLNNGGPMVCCNGLQAKLPPSGMMHGSTCVKPENLNCLGEGYPVFQHPGAPKCCSGFVPGKAPAQSPITFSDICMREDRAPRVNNNEGQKDTGRRSWLREDPAGSSVSGQ